MKLQAQECHISIYVEQFVEFICTQMAIKGSYCSGWKVEESQFRAQDSHLFSSYCFQYCKLLLDLLYYLFLSIFACPFQACPFQAPSDMLTHSSSLSIRTSKKKKIRSFMRMVYAFILIKHSLITYFCRYNIYLYIRLYGVIQAIFLYKHDELHVNL